MEFITEEISKELNLTPEQIQGLEPVYNNHLATLKQTWDNTAKEKADNTINGAIHKIVEETKIAKNDGEKLSEYLLRVKNTSVNSLKNEYEEKLKNFKGDEAG